MSKLPVEKPTRWQKPPVKPRQPDSSYHDAISEEQEMLIGRAITRWSRLELILDEIIWKMLKLDMPAGRVVTSNFDTTRKIKVVKTLGPILLRGDNLDHLPGVIVRLEELYDLRNTFAHGHWVTVMPENVPASLSIRDKLPQGADTTEVVAVHLNPEAMKQIITGIMTASHNLVVLRNSLSASPKIPSQQGG